MRSIRWGVLLIAVLTIAPLGVAQSVPKLTRAQMLSFAAERSGVRALAGLQAAGRLQAAAYADTLAAIANSAEVDIPGLSKASAISALWAAAADGNTAYSATALDHLLLVTSTAAKHEIRQAATGLIGHLPDEKKAVALLTEIAQRNDAAAQTAVDVLAHRGPAGTGALRALFEANSVVQPYAKEHLEVLARANKWMK